MILYVLLALLAIGIFIFVHELGHFWAARIVNIPVKEFAIGFGPTLLSWNSKKHGTKFVLRPIPMGGYCMYYGDTDDKETQSNDPRDYYSASVWKRLFCVISGPLMNIVLAFVLAIILMSAYGAVPVDTYIHDVTIDSPADEAGILSGDILLAINDTTINTTDSLAVSAMLGDAIETDPTVPVSLTVKRGEETVNVSVQADYNETENRYLMGVILSQHTTKLPISQIIPSAYELCANASVAIWNSLGALFTTGEGLDQASGPIGIISLIAEETQKGGLQILLQLSILISINLGIMNLIPIPGLDGSHIVYFIIEAITGKPINKKVAATINAVGYIFLLSIIIWFSYKDIVRLFSF